MYSILNRDDLAKLKKLQESKSLMKAERLKQLLGKQDFHYDMEEVFEAVTENQTKQQQQQSEKQIQALRDSTQTTTHAIQAQTEAIKQSSNILNKNLQKSIEKGIQEYDKISNRNNQLVTNLVNSNLVDSSIVKTISNLLNDKNKSQFSLEPVEGNPNLFIINPHNPQQVLIKGSTHTFLSNNNMYNLNDPDLSYFISNAQLDTQPQKVNLIGSFLKDMKYNINYGDKKSKRYYFTKDLNNEYIYQLIPYQLSQLGSGLNFTTGRSKSLIGTDQRPANPAVYIFLPFDPDELVDQIKLLYFEKVRGNDNPQLNEQIIAIVDKLFEYECITTNQHQNLISTFLKKDQFVDETP